MAKADAPTKLAERRGSGSARGRVIRRGAAASRKSRSWSAKNKATARPVRDITCGPARRSSHFRQQAWSGCLAEDELELGVELQIVFAAISLFCAVAANASWRVDDIIKVFE
jgi:hypothetical protein